MIVEHRFDERLAVVERAFDCNGVNVRFGRRRHHPALDVGHASLWKQDHDVDALRGPECLDCGAAGIARRRADDCRARVPLFEHVIHEAREELHRNVLEGERRAVEQFEDRQAGSDFDERRHLGRVEGRVGVGRHAPQLIARDLVAREGMNDVDRDLDERLFAKRRDRVGRQRWPDFGDVKTAVARQSRKQDVFKSERFRPAPRRNVFQ